MSNESKTLLEQIRIEQDEKLAMRGELEQLRVQNDAYSKQVAALIAERDALAASVKEAAEKHASEMGAIKAQLDAAQAELNGAKQLLANPAMADAKATGNAVGTDGGVIGGESAAVAEMTSEEAHKQYKAISDAKAKREFRKLHWKALGCKEEK